LYHTPPRFANPTYIIAPVAQFIGRNSCGLQSSRPPYGVPYPPTIQHPTKHGGSSGYDGSRERSSVVLFDFRSTRCWSGNTAVRDYYCCCRVGRARVLVYLRGKARRRIVRREPEKQPAYRFDPEKEQRTK
ncbi:unnamed protein product, partial [Ectocarpus sp. 8 AP-2014]